MRTVCFFILLPLLIILSTPTFAQTDKWQEEYATGIKLLEERKFSQAVEYLERSVNGAIEELGEENREVATIYYNIGILYQKISVNTRAIRNLTRSVEIFKQILPENDIKLTEYMIDLADLYYEQGDSFAALDLFTDINNIFESNNIKSKELAKVCSKIAMIYTALNENSNAEIYFLRALNTLEEQYSKYSLELIPGLKDVAMLYSMNGDINKSIDYQKRIVSVLEMNFENADIDLLIESYQKIGDLYKLSGDMDNADKHYKEAYKTSRNEYGLSSSETETALDEYYSFRASIGRSTFRYEDLPRLVLTVAAGYYKTPAVSLGKEYKLRPRIDGMISLRFFRNYFLYYCKGGLSTYMFESYYSSLDIYNEKDEHVIGTKFKLSSNNIGIEFHVKEFFNIDNTGNWISTGISNIDSRKIEKVDYKCIVIINDNEFLVTREKENEYSSNSTGFFIELGHSVTYPNFIMKNMTMGISFGARYEYCKFEGSNIGGFTFLVGTNFLIF